MGICYGERIIIAMLIHSSYRRVQIRLACFRQSHTKVLQSRRPRWCNNVFHVNSFHQLMTEDIRSSPVEIILPDRPAREFYAVFFWVVALQCKLTVHSLNNWAMQPCRNALLCTVQKHYGHMPLFISAVAVFINIINLSAKWLVSLIFHD